MNLREVARSYYDAGLNVLPALKSQKRPIGSWKSRALERPPFEEAFPDGLEFDALALVCGATSGGLEIIDFDQKGALFDAFAALVGSALDGLVLESTQNGGKHLGYRCREVGRNTKLATNDVGCAIETRGVGGICIVAPTDGYALEAGRWEEVPRIDEVVRGALLDAARSLDQSRKERGTFTCSSKNSSSTNTRINDDVVGKSISSAEHPFTRHNVRESVADYMKRVCAGKKALARHGWDFIRTDGDYEQFRRPRQPDLTKPGLSYHVKERYYHCFTTNGAPLEVDKTYSDLQLVAALDFGGDVSACATEYGRQSGFSDDFHPVRVMRPVVVATPKEPSSPTASKKVAMSPKLFECGGLIQELYELTMSSSIRPQPEGALLGATATMSYLAGRSVFTSYNGVLIAPNLYALFLAPSGMGKEAIRRTAAAIAHEYNPDDGSPESFASVQALQNLVSRTKKVFWLHDEFGRDLAVMTGSKANANTSSIITESLKLYSNATNQAYKPKMIASEAKGVKESVSVERPHLTIFATGNPSEFFDAASESILSNGYVARFSIVLSNEYVEKRRVDYDAAVNATSFELTDSIKRSIKQWRLAEESSSRTTLRAPFTREAFELLTDFDLKNERRLKESTISVDGAGEALARFAEKSWKYALNAACGKYGPTSRLTIDRECAEFAVRLAEYESELFAMIAGRFGASATNKLSQKIYDWARERGVFTKRDFTRRFQREEKRTREEALQNLVDAERVTRCRVEQGGKEKEGYQVELD